MNSKCNLSSAKRKIKLSVHSYLVISEVKRMPELLPSDGWFLHTSVLFQVSEDKMSWHCTECNQVTNVTLADHQSKSTLQLYNQEKRPTILLLCKQFQLLLPSVLTANLFCKTHTLSSKTITRYHTLTTKIAPA